MGTGCTDGCERKRGIVEGDDVPELHQGEVIVSAPGDVWRDVWFGRGLWYVVLGAPFMLPPEKLIPPGALLGPFGTSLGELVLPIGHGVALSKTFLVSR